MKVRIHQACLALVAALFSFVLAGCGGGGSDGEADAADEPRSAEAAGGTKAREAAQAALGPLVNGGLVSGSLVTANQSNSYTFTANAGQALLLSVARTTGTFDPVLYLYDPTGRHIRTATGSQVANLSWNATVTGTYTVVVFDGGTGVQTGNYELHYARAPGANEHGALVNGGLKAGALTVGDLDSYTFTANAGQALLLSVARTSGAFDPVLYLYDPSGRHIRTATGSQVANLSWNATVTGTYTVVVFDGGTGVQTGNYELHYARAPGASEHGALTSGVAKAGAMTVGDLDSYTFPVVNGRSFRVSVTRTSGAFDPVVYLYDPSGRHVRTASGSQVAELTWTATVAGTYTVVAFDGGTGVQTGDYLALLN